MRTGRGPRLQASAVLLRRIRRGMSHDLLHPSRWGSLPRKLRASAVRAATSGAMLPHREVDPQRREIACGARSASDSFWRALRARTDGGRLHPERGATRAVVTSEVACAQWFAGGPSRSRCAWQATRLRVVWFCRRAARPRARRQHGSDREGKLRRERRGEPRRQRGGDRDRRTPLLQRGQLDRHCLDAPAYPRHD